MSCKNFERWKQQLVGTTCTDVFFVFIFAYKQNLWRISVHLTDPKKHFFRMTKNQYNAEVFICSTMFDFFPLPLIFFRIYTLISLVRRKVTSMEYFMRIKLKMKRISLPALAKHCIPVCSELVLSINDHRRRTWTLQSRLWCLTDFADNRWGGRFDIYLCHAAHSHACKPGLTVKSRGFCTRRPGGYLRPNLHLTPGMLWYWAQILF